MNRVSTAERVSAQEPSDNFVFQRSKLAYHFAAQHISGKVLEIGTGSGYGVDILAPHATEFITIDKFAGKRDFSAHSNVEFCQATVPPLPFDDESFDCVVSFQVIEHIEDDGLFVREVQRVLKKGGMFILSTPNAKMSLTRNPWHVREYTSAELSALLWLYYAKIKRYGIVGNEKIMEYYNANREGVQNITRLDIFRLQQRLPRWALQIPFDIFNRLNRLTLLRKNSTLTRSITMEDYSVEAVSPNAFDLIYIATK